VDCVEHALQGLPTEATVAALVVDAVTVARRLTEGKVGSAELTAVWRSLRLPTRSGKVGMLLRAAKACIFPRGVSEAARHSAVCAARGTGGGESVVRTWQAVRLQELLLRGALPNHVLQRAAAAMDGGRHRPVNAHRQRESSHERMSGRDCQMASESLQPSTSQVSSAFRFIAKSISM
jgi:hypothetical protein